MWRRIIIAGLSVLLAMQGVMAQDQNTKITDPRVFIETICAHIRTTAGKHGVPEAFLARLIWKESRFDPNAVSPKGAQGIAQFMPATARERGLADPFEPIQAIEASASYLSELKSELGNWGLAASGYNAGPNRVKAWLLGLSTLPYETRDFVAAITEHSANDWRDKDFIEPEFELKPGTDFMTACTSLPSRNLLYLSASLDPGLAPIGTWGVILASHFSRTKALSIFDRLQTQYPSVLKEVKPSVARRVNRSFGPKPRFEIQLAADSRRQANALCSKLRGVGGTCMVLRN